MNQTQSSLSGPKSEPTAKGPSSVFVHIVSVLQKEPAAFLVPLGFYGVSVLFLITPGPLELSLSD